MAFTLFHVFWWLWFIDWFINWFSRNFRYFIKGVWSFTKILNYFIKGFVLFGKDLVVIFGPFELSIHALNSDLFLLDLMFERVKLRVEVKMSFFTFKKLLFNVIKLFFQIFQVFIGHLTNFLICLFTSSQLFIQVG